MPYNPTHHHRRSIRLKGYNYSTPGAYFITLCTHQRQCLFGDIVDGEMRLNTLGNIARSHWQNLSRHHPHLQLDEFVIMPNHVHGILVISDTPVGAGLADSPSVRTVSLTTKPAPTNAARCTDRPGIPDIIRGFKTFSARRINQIRNALGTPVWQRNYYEHIIRNEDALQMIRAYVQTNPQAWTSDRLHPALV